MEDVRAGIYNQRHSLILEAARLCKVLLKKNVRWFLKSNC